MKKGFFLVWCIVLGFVVSVGCSGGSRQAQIPTDNAPTPKDGPVGVGGPGGGKTGTGGSVAVPKTPPGN